MAIYRYRNCFLKFYTSIDLIAYNLHDSVVKESCLKTADPEFKSAGGFCSCFRELCIFPKKCFPACLTNIIFMVHAIYHNQVVFSFGVFFVFGVFFKGGGCVCLFFCPFLKVSHANVIGYSKWTTTFHNLFKIVRKSLRYIYFRILCCLGAFSFIVL